MGNRVYTSRGNTLSAPIWMKDFGGRENLMPFPALLDVDQFDDEGGVKVQIMTTPLTGGVNEVQTITINGTGGVFNVVSAIPGFAGTATGLAWNATAAVVQAAVESFLGVGNVEVSLASLVYTFKFKGALGFQNVAQLATTGSAITGGGTSATPATVTAGSAGSTTATVAATSDMIHRGTILRFRNGASALVTAKTEPGVTSIPIAGLTGDVAVGDFAYSNRAGRKLIQSGRLIGRTYAERDAYAGFGPWQPGDDEVFLLAFTVNNAYEDNDCELYRPTRAVAENYLPDWSLLSAAAKTQIRSLYRCFVGHAG